jgi:hypothetical protein
MTSNGFSRPRTFAISLTSATRNFYLALTLRAFAVVFALAMKRGERSRPRTLYPLSASGIEWRPIPQETSRILECFGTLNSSKIRTSPSTSNFVDSALFSNSFRNRFPCLMNSYRGQSTSLLFKTLSGAGNSMLNSEIAPRRYLAP